MPQRLPPLRAGHEIELLQGSVELFPALEQAIGAAQHEVLLETYIFDFTGASDTVALALEHAARRGVSVRVVVDGVGSGNSRHAWRHRLEQAGVQWRVYSPPGRFGLLAPRQWRRLHRKLCVVDGHTGFCGGINLLDDFHDPNHGSLDAPRLDFAVRVTGPLVEQMRATMIQFWLRMEARNQLRQGHLRGILESLRSLRRARPAPVPESQRPLAGEQTRAALLLRDNLRNRTQIERAYLRAIGRAREEIIIANAYFVPGRRMRNALLQARKRGVTVVLLLQGRYEYFMQYYAARPVFGALLRSGAELHEYAPSFLHSKVAVIDSHWATVGSSNLDPLSLLLAREANIVVEDRAFALQLRQRLMHAVLQEGRPMERGDYENRPLVQRLKEHGARIVMRIALMIQGKNY